MKLVLITLCLLTTLFSKNLDIKQAFLVALLTEDGKQENVQHKIKTQNDYNGNLFSKVAIIGKYDKNMKILAKIGNSTGKLIDSQPLYNTLTKIIYGYELTFKHQDVTNGYFELIINDNLYDTKVFVQ